MEKQRPSAQNNVNCQNITEEVIKYGSLFGLQYKIQMPLFSILNGRMGFAIYIVELQNCGASFKCSGCSVRMLNVYFLKSQFPNILIYLFVFNHVLVNNGRPISIAFVFHMFICCQSACRRPISKGIVENPSVQESWPRMELSSLVGE